MMTPSNQNIFPVTGPLYGEFIGRRWNSLTKQVTRSFDIFFELCMNKQLSKQSYVVYCTNKIKQDPLQI